MLFSGVTSFKFKHTVASIGTTKLKLTTRIIMFLNAVYISLDKTLPNESVYYK